MIGAAVLTSTLLVTIMDVSDDADDDEASGASTTTAVQTPETHASAAGTTPEQATTVTTLPSPTTTVRVASLGPAPPSEPDGTPESTGAATDRAVPAPAVTMIQTVPPVRDLLVVVDGRLEVTDAAGELQLREASPDSAIRVIGPAADPPIQQVEFVTWADGSSDSERPLASLTGPTAQIGLEIRTRVIVELDDGVAVGDAVVFRSEQLGEVRVPVGSPTWVVSARAVRTGTGKLTSQLATYQAESVVAGGRLVAVAPTTFLPTPEALWTIEPD